MEVILILSVAYIIGANIYIAKKKREDGKRGIQKHWWEY